MINHSKTVLRNPLDAVFIIEGVPYNCLHLKILLECLKFVLLFQCNAFLDPLAKDLGKSYKGKREKRKM